MKKGLIVASFGTTHKDTYDACIKPIVDMAKKEFSDMYVTEAFTSRIVKRILSKRDGININDEKEAIAELKEKGVDEIYIAPLHLLRGVEYEKLMVEGTKLGNPLYMTLEDLQEFSEKVSFSLTKGDALVLMGHGSDHKAEWVYEALEKEYHRLGYENFFIATVEGSITLEDILPRLKKKGIRKAYLRPLMLVAGDHAKNDMAGDEKDSWKNVLADNGIQPEVVLEGLGEIDTVRELYLRKMRELLER